MKKQKPNLKKVVKKHLHKDIKEARNGISDDKFLIKKLNKSKGNK